MKEYHVLNSLPFEANACSIARTAFSNLPDAIAYRKQLDGGAYIEEVEIDHHRSSTSAAINEEIDNLSTALASATTHIAELDKQIKERDAHIKLMVTENGALRAFIISIETACKSRIERHPVDEVAPSAPRK